MLKSRYTYYPLLFILISLIQINSKLNVPENSFIPLKSREIIEFELNKTKSEVYFSYQNDFEDSDMIINLKVAKGFTTHFYIYDSYDNIQTNSQGDYINYLKESTITENFVILKDSEISIKKTKYYIIIKDIINSYYTDYISIFNEQDTIYLENEQYITLEKFYSQNKYWMSFSHTKNEIVTLELNIDNTEFIQYISIYSENTQDLIYVGEKNKGEIKINEDLDSEGTYIIEIESEEEPYTDVKSSFILHKDSKKVKELNYNNPLNLAFSGNKVFNIYVDIDDYDYNDENIITFKFGNQVFEKKLLSHCYGKVMNFESNDDDKFLANMPAKEDDNEAIFERLSGTTDVYQLYFRKNQKKEVNKKSYLLINLCLEIEEHIEEEYIAPEEFKVWLSKKPETIKLGEYSNKNVILNENIQLQNYIPLIYKVVFPKIDEDYSNKLSYIFYTSENIQVFYNDTMLSTDNHLYEELKMIHAISPKDEGYDYTNNIFIKLYGFSNNKVNFRIESSEALVFYIHNDFRKIKTFSDLLTECDKPFYYIGDYGLFVEKGYLYQETLYGKINTYYKGKINSQDKTILINEDSKYLIEKNLFSLDTSIDIVELKCEVPGFYQVHLVDNVDKRDINLYSKIYNYLPAGKNFTITPILSPIQEDINFEIYTSMGKEIKISDGIKETKINSNNKYYQIQYKKYSEVPTSFTVLSNDDTVISISLSNKDPFVIIDKPGTTHVDYYSQIAVKLPKDKKYYSINVVITRVFHGYAYSLFKGNVDYASKLIESEYHYFTIDRSYQINKTVSNPYLKDEDDEFYIMFSIDDPEMIQKDVIVIYNEIKEYETIENGKSKIISSENKKYSLPKLEKPINIIYQSCANSLKEIDIYNYDDKIKTIVNKENNSYYQHNKIQNYALDFQININFKKNSKDNPEFLNGASIGITDQEIKDEDINKYSEMKLNVSQKGNKVQWEEIENNKQYDIYVLSINNSYTNYLKNPCFLQYIKNNSSFLKNEDNYIKHYSSKNNSITMEEKGNYTVVVSANVEGKIPLVYIYDEINYDSNLNPPDDDESDSDSDGDDDEDSNGKGTIIFLAIALPLVMICVIILLIVLIKSKKTEVINTEETKEPIIRDTTQSE